MSGGLSARVVVRRPAFTLDAALEVAAGTTVALVGPNGAGKSTLLRALAGLAPLDGGRVELAGEVLDDPAVGVRVAPPDRRTGVVFQDLRLFPHLSALDNVAFGLRRRGASRRAARETARGWLDRVGLAGLADRRPAALSGGQAQRVALARALAPAPGLLLLDEPLSALDAATRLAVRAELRQHLAAYAGPAVLVTHDPLDALVLADRVVVLEDGRVVQDAAPAEVARAPRTAWAARLLGLNHAEGVAAAGVVRLTGGGALTAAQAPDGPVVAVWAPSAVALHRDRPSGSPRNAWQGRVTGVEQHASGVRVALDGPPATLADVTAAAVAELGLVPGADVWASLKATEVRVAPR